MHYHFHGYSNPTSDTRSLVSATTKFEIGSITKSLVGFVLATLVTEKAVQLDTELGELFSDLTSDTKRISLKQLATHRSGLPRLPANQSLADMNNPYSAYDATALFKALQESTPAARDFAYSNFGFGTLGTALEKASDESLNNLIQRIVFSPAKMPSSAMAMNDAKIRGIADGHNLLFEKVSHWTFDAMAGAGAAVSTAQDMLSLGAYLLENKTEPSVSLFLSPQTSQVPLFGVGIMLKDSIAFHGGQTGGFGSFFAIDVENEKVVVVLTNVSKDAGKLGFNVMQQLGE